MPNYADGLNPDAYTPIHAQGPFISRRITNMQKSNFSLIVLIKMLKNIQKKPT